MYGKLPTTSPLIIICNQPTVYVSYLLLPLFKKQIKFIIGAKYKQSILKRYYHKFLHSIFISESLVKKVSHKSILQILKKLKKSEIICIYPEGKVNPCIDTFNRGCFYLSNKSQVPILPIRFNIQNKRFYPKIEIFVGDIIIPQNENYLKKEVSKFFSK